MRFRDGWHLIEWFTFEGDVCDLPPSIVAAALLADLYASGRRRR